MAADGFAYESVCIEQWLGGQDDVVHDGRKPPDVPNSFPTVPSNRRSAPSSTRRASSGARSTRTRINCALGYAPSRSSTRRGSGRWPRARSTMTRLGCLFRI